MRESKREREMRKELSELLFQYDLQEHFGRKVPKEILELERLERLWELEKDARKK